MEYKYFQVKIQTHSITLSENTTFITVNGVTMQKASLFHFIPGNCFKHKFHSLNTDSMSFQYLMDQSRVFDGVLMQWNSYLTHVTREANWK